MPRVKPGERKRARRPKTRTGCRTCKIRRVKCDETKPFCSRCTSTGRKCEGYEYPESAEGNSLKIRTVALSSVFGTPEEQRAFRYFCERTTWELSGFHESEFWNRMILQAVHTDPSIRYAVTALSSLHERFEKTGEVATSQGDFALKQYNLAITKHLDALTHPDKKTQSVDTYLASCMIFICIELLQGHFVSASQLIQGAIQLLYENHPGSKTNKSAWPFEVFEALLCHLQTQCVGLFGPSARPKVHEPRFMSASRRAIPKKFESITQARDFLDYYSWHFSFADPSSVDNQVYRKSMTFYIDILNQWTAAFDMLLKSLGPNISDKEQCAVYVLRIRQYMGSLSIDVAFRQSQQDGQALWNAHYHRNDDQTPESAYDDIFSQVLTMAEQVIQLSESWEQKPWKTNTFTLDYGLVSPMYDVARKCRDPSVRRKAIDLLYANPCREAFWDGVVAARIAERVMLMEENAVPKVEKASDIPTSARVSRVVPTYVSDSKGPVVSYEREPDSITGKTVQEVVGLKPANDSGRIVPHNQSRSSRSTSSSTSSASPT